MHPNSIAATIDGGAASPNQDFEEMLSQQKGLYSEAMPDTDEIRGWGIEPDLEDSEGLKTTTIVWMYVTIFGLLVWVVLCIFAYSAGRTRQDCCGNKEG